MKKAFVVLAVFCIAFVAVSIASGAGKAMGEKGADTRLASRQKAPNFMLTNLEGKVVKLLDFRGKVVILDFWATWCPPCREGIPDFIALQEQYGDKGFQMVGISLDQGGVSVVRPFVVENGINYPVLLTDGKVESAYGGIRGIPTTFVIDKTGNIRTKYIGFTQKERFEKDIVALLGEK